MLEHVNLCHLDPYFLYDITEREAHLLDTKDCRKLFDEAKKYLALKDRQLEMEMSSVSNNLAYFCTRLL